jgi:hypothetical protein
LFLSIGRKYDRTPSNLTSNKDSRSAGYLPSKMNRFNTATFSRAGVYMDEPGKTSAWHHSNSPQGIRREKGVKRSMPVIVIVLMFLVAFLLAVLAMILAPLLGLGYAHWNRGSQSLPENPASTFANAELQPSGSNDSRYRSK